MGINFLAILTCGVVAMILGMIWHSKALFGDKYMKAIGADTNMSPEKMKEIQKNMWQLYVTQFILALFQAYVLSGYIISEPTAGGSLNAIWIWAGFVMPTIAGAAMWSARPRKMAWQIFLISSGYNLVLFILFGMVIKAWI